MGERGNGTKLGRPPKFGRPSQLVAITLPKDTVRALRSIHPDLGWAILTLFEQEPSGQSTPSTAPFNVQLTHIGKNRSVIVVDRRLVRNLPGVDIVPIDGDRALLAVEPGRGMADLELAVIDRLASRGLGRAERRTLEELRARLAHWRLDRRLQSRMRAIVVLEEQRATGPRRGGAAGRASRAAR
jgi:hypothetical protein